jgi:UDP:flavonoid glycosyltransferase YjiC (YdhE family)
MARIIFYPLAEVGHVNATFKLAKRLRARGHDIRYMSLPDVEDHVRAHGWDFIPQFGDLFPKGYLDTAGALLGSEAPMSEKRVVMREKMRRMALQLPEVLFGSDFEAQLRGSQADLLLVDTTYSMPALTALRLGIPAAILSTTLPLRADPLVPPLESATPPPTGWWSRLKIRATWDFIANGGRAGYGGFMRAQIQELSRRHPELGRLCSFRTHLQHGPNVNIPTLVACCSEFDFPRASLENLHYIGPGVDLEREDAPLPPEVEQDPRPLLYCSLGSLGHRALPHRPFFQAVLDMVARKPDWRLLLVVGKSLDVASLRIPPNATVVPFAPQLSALRRASLMITHGGLNSVKECICLGVPMLVFPTGFDQPGNGARVVHHGLGLMGNIRQTTPEKLSSMLDAVAGDPSYRARVRAMREIFLAADASNRGVELVERLIADGPVTATSQPRLAATA